MAEFEEAAPKKSSWLMTCGILFVVFGLGFLAVVGVGGYYAYTMYFAPPAEATVAGLLSVVNNTPDTANVACTAPDGDAWALQKDVAPGETAQLEIGHRPASCAVTAGAATASWSIQDPPAADETWTLSLAAPEAAPPAGEVIALHNRSGWVAKVSCSGANGAWTDAKDLLNGSDAELTLQGRPATCTATAGMGSKEFTFAAEAAPTDLLVAWLLPEGDSFLLSPTETAPAAVAATEPAATPPVAPAATEPAATTTKPTSSTTASTSSSKSTSSTSSTTAKSGSTTTSASTTKPTTTSSTASTTSTPAATTPSTGTGGGTRPAAVEEEEEEDEDLPDTSVLTAIRVDWAKGARKSTPWTVVVDGKKVGPIPAKSLVNTGVHKIKVTATGESPVECTVTASGGEDILFSFDPENPKCPR